MGYGIMAYQVDEETIRGLEGSGNDQIRRAISGRFRRDIYRMNDDFGLSNERGADNMFEAIRHLIMGTERPLPGYMYGYAYKMIVEFHGRFLDNSCFYPCNMAYIMEELDPQLSALGVTLDLSSLGGCSGLMNFPLPDDFPSFGFWDAAEIAQAHEVLRQATGLNEAMTAISGWVAQAHANKQIIVGFYH